MALTQSPVDALAQAEWYLEHQGEEVLPGAFVLAAGNLTRQVLEQILFVLCFYGGVSKGQVLRRDGTMHTAGRLIRELERVPDGDSMSRISVARRRHPLLASYGRPIPTLKKWVRLLNEPSHFANPLGGRRTSVQVLSSLLLSLRALPIPELHGLIVAAVTEWRSNGRFRVRLSERSPFVTVESTIVVRPKHLVVRDGELVLAAPAQRLNITRGPGGIRLGGRKKAIMVLGQSAPALGVQLVATDGKPLDLTSMKTILESMARSPARRQALTNRLRRLGFSIDWRATRT
jgi:hypothetical protein